MRNRHVISNTTCATKSGRCLYPRKWDTTKTHVGSSSCVAKHLSGQVMSAEINLCFLWNVKSQLSIFENKVLGIKGFISVNVNSRGWLSCYVLISSLWPSDTIWRHRSGSTLAQVMNWCLTGTRHYMRQRWIIISEILWVFTWERFHIEYRSYYFV